MKATRKPVFLLLTLPVLWAVPSLPGETLPLTQTTFVRSGINESKNYNEGGSLEVISRGGDNNRKIYIRADLGDLVPSGKKCVNSTLTLRYFTNPLLGERDGEITLMVYGITTGDDWVPDELTWSNAPRNNVSNNSGVLEEGTVLLGTILIDTDTVAAGETVSLSGADLDSYLTWAAGNLGDAYHTNATSGPATFIITSAGKNSDVGVSFHSDNRPIDDRPVLNFELKPE